MKRYDKVKRIVKKEYNEQSVIFLERFKCTKCNHIQRVYPDEVIPFKQYSKTVIVDVLEGFVDEETLGYEDYPSSMTMTRWKKLYMKGEKNMEKMYTIESHWFISNDNLKIERKLVREEEHKYAKKGAAVDAYDKKIKDDYKQEFSVAASWTDGEHLMVECGVWEWIDIDGKFVKNKAVRYNIFES